MTIYAPSPRARFPAAIAAKAGPKQRTSVPGSIIVKTFRPPLVSASLYPLACPSTASLRALPPVPRLSHRQVTICANAGLRNQGRAAFSRVAGLELRASGEPAPAPARSLQGLPGAFLPRRIGQPDRTTHA